jgi:hypothetical protein
MTRRPIQLTSRNILTLDGNVADTFLIDMESRVQKVKAVNIWPGHLYVLLFSQDNAGGHLFTWPGNILNAQPVDLNSHAKSVQCFVGITGNILEAIAPGSWR